MRIAQPALSRQVQQLEGELGLQLLVRAGRQVLLTDPGQALMRHARTIQRDFERLVEDMQARKETPSGRVVFGIPPALSDIVVPHVVQRISREYPLISMRVVEGVTPVLAEWVQNNEVDLAILSLAYGAGVERSRGLRLEPLAHEDMAIFERPSVNRRLPPVTSLAELQSKPLALSDLYSEIVRWQLQAPDLTFKVVLRIDAVQAIKAMVLKGEVAAILPVSMLSEELRSGEVAASLITSRGVRRQLNLAQPSLRQMTRAAETVMRVIKEEMNRMSLEGLFTLGRPPTLRRAQNGGRNRANGRGRGSKLPRATAAVNASNA